MVTEIINTRDLISDAFEELGLAIGGLIALYEVPDPFVESLFHHLEEIHARTTTMVDVENPCAQKRVMGSGLEPHPAVERFLKKIRMLHP